MRRLGLIAAAGALGFCLLCISEAEAGAVLDRVREAGLVRCGVLAGQPGLALRDDAGGWRGFDVDLCRAVAAAALEEGGKTELVPLSGEPGRAALIEGRLDLLARQPAMPRLAAEGGVRFATHSLIEGQGLLVPRNAQYGNALVLGPASVCIPGDPGLGDNLLRFASKGGGALTPQVHKDEAALVAAFLAGDCGAVSAGRLALAALRAALPDPAGYEILPDLLSRDPQGPSVAAGDREWLSLVRWTVFALITAEELGVTRANAGRLRRRSDDLRIERLLGAVPGLGEGLGLDDGWAYRAIVSAGNYGELYDRHLGSGDELKLERGPNALWLDGGLLHAPPFR
ncbi:MAG: transporter substrate-binding domain-containing protein [Kiloniellales bacterium]|nr:transporter substrate-binding domain-containing protein [Kiloniellales bacterium]